MYQSDLTKEQYEKIERYLQSDGRNGGRPLKHSKYHILNAILYVLKTGCQWRQLPKDFPPWQTTYTQFKRWKEIGIFEYINKKITQETKEVLIDSRSVRSSHELKKKIKDLMVIK